MEDNKSLIVDENHKIFDTTNMFYKEFPSDYRQIRYFTLLIVQKAPPEIKEINLLEQQISEIIKNAVKHGNRNNPEKKIKVWYSFDITHAHVIVEDEGEGFKDLPSTFCPFLLLAEYADLEVEDLIKGQAVLGGFEVFPIIWEVDLKEGIR